jgi:hypothetical protein
VAWGQVLDHHDWKRPKHRLRSGLRRADVGDVALSVRNPGIGALATTHHQQQQVVVGAIFILGPVRLRAGEHGDSYPSQVPLPPRKARAYVCDLGL